jgi:hypothetical protein
MADIKFIWTVTNLERKCNTGLVLGAAYSIEATDEVYKSSLTGTLEFDLPEDEKPEVPFCDLTPDLVVGWIKAKMGDENIQKVEQALTTALSEQRRPTRALGLPWSAA